jgi:hypothetical protein
VAAAELFAVHSVTGRRWAASGTTGPVAILLRLLVDGKITIKDVEKARRG